MCGNCQKQSHDLWAIGPPYPKWETVKSVGFVELVKCPECGQLWVESYYEPFAAFRYAIKWPADIETFSKMNAIDDGKTLCRWHEAEIRIKAKDADEQTLNYIQAHYRRSSGHVNLTPSDEPNPVKINDT